MKNQFRFFLYLVIIRGLPNFSIGENINMQR